MVSYTAVVSPDYTYMVCMVAEVVSGQVHAQTTSIAAYFKGTIFADHSLLKFHGNRSRIPVSYAHF